jgi:hypothetical protein
MTSTCHDQTVDFVADNCMCEAVGCFEKAAVDIAAKVGEQKKITLTLCQQCVKKFEA